MSRTNRASMAWLGFGILVLVVLVALCLCTNVDEWIVSVVVKAFAAPNDSQSQTHGSDVVLVDYPPELPNPVGK